MKIDLDVGQAGSVHDRLDIVGLIFEYHSSMGIWLVIVAALLEGLDDGRRTVATVGTWFYHTDFLMNNHSRRMREYKSRQDRSRENNQRQHLGRCKGEMTYQNRNHVNGSGAVIHFIYYLPAHPCRISCG